MVLFRALSRSYACDIENLQRTRASPGIPSQNAKSPRNRFITRRRRARIVTVEIARTRLAAIQHGWSQAMIGESEPILTSSPASESPQFGGFLQELAACDSSQARMIE